MDYSNIRKIEVLTDHKYVNKYLDLGWKVALIYATASETDSPYVYHQVAHFVLFWGKGEPQYPDPNYPELEPPKRLANETIV